jgi:hypothetical chaperone protein
MRSFYADERQHRRLMIVLTERLGHALAGAAEQAKIESAPRAGARARPGGRPPCCVGARP